MTGITQKTVGEQGESMDAPFQLTQDHIDAVLAAVMLNYSTTCHDVRRFEGTLDNNFRFTDADGSRKLIKVSDCRTAAAVLDWQAEVLARISTAQLSFEIPRLVHTMDGMRRIIVNVGTEQYHVRVMTWVEGPLMADLELYPASLVEHLGRVSAELTQAMTDVVPPANLVEHDWKAVDSGARVRSALSALPCDVQSGTVRMVMEFYDKHVSAVGDLGELPQATVHQDLNGHNVIVDSTGTRIAGVIDFNDTIRTARVADVALAMAYAMMGMHDPMPAAQGVLEGYAQVIQLTPDEIQVVFPLAMARLCASWANWTLRQMTEPTAYGAMRQALNWPVIERLVGQGLEAIQREIVKAHNAAPKAAKFG